MTPEELWRGIDRLAAKNGLSASGLAVRAGLDASVFNQSKRVNNGRPHWITLETLSKILKVTNTSLVDFVNLIYLPED
ncbi:helix-turn-helix domain-containing protein [bacterium]|nr:helix-turn-helix domain-containing protein [bacterium]